MNAEPVSPLEVRRQIWESMVTMLRVYAHAASLNNGEYGVADSAENVLVTFAGGILQIHYSPQTGAGHWQLENAGNDAGGKFQIDQDGQLLFPDGPKELDDAAIHWIQQLGHTSCAV